MRGSQHCLHTGIIWRALRAPDTYEPSLDIWCTWSGVHPRLWNFKKLPNQGREPLITALFSPRANGKVFPILPWGSGRWIMVLKDVHTLISGICACDLDDKGTLRRWSGVWGEGVWDEEFVLGYPESLMQWKGSLREGCRRNQSQIVGYDKKPRDKEKGVNMLCYLLALKMKERCHKPKNVVVSGSWKGPGKIFPWSLQNECSQVDSFSMSDSHTGR